MGDGDSLTNFKTGSIDGISGVSRQEHQHSRNNSNNNNDLNTILNQIVKATRYYVR